MELKSASVYSTIYQINTNLNSVHKVFVFFLFIPEASRGERKLFRVINHLAVATKKLSLSIPRRGSVDDVKSGKGKISRAIN